MSIGSAFKISDNAFQWGKAYVDGLSKGTRDGLAEQEEYRKQAAFDAQQTQQGLDNTRRTAQDGRQASLDSSNLGFRTNEENRRQQSFDERDSGGEGKRGSGLKGTLAEKSKYVYGLAYEQALDRGYRNPGATAAAIVAGAIPESTLDPARVNAADWNESRTTVSPSIGYIQWRDGRNAALRRFAQQEGKPWQDGPTQIKHLFNELDSAPNERQYGDRLKAAANPNEAMEAVMGFIRFGGHNKQGHPERTKRFTALNGVLSSASAGSWEDGARDNIRSRGNVGGTQDGEYGLPTPAAPAQTTQRSSELAPPPTPAQPTARPPVENILPPRNRTRAEQEAAGYGGATLAPPPAVGDVLKALPPPRQFDAPNPYSLKKIAYEYDGSFMSEDQQQQQPEFYNPFDAPRQPPTSNPAYYTQPPEEMNYYGMDYA